MNELAEEAKALNARAAALPPIYTLPLDQARARMRESLMEEPRPSQLIVTDFAVATTDDQVLVRSYHPAPGSTKPVLVFFHGGGWVFNDIDTHDTLCRIVAEVSDCLVLSVDYHLSPEHRYPTAINEGRDVVDWVVANASSIDADPAAIALGGDSAGGQIAIALTKRLRDEGGPAIRAQFLLYPVLDYWDPGTPSYDERGAGFAVTLEFMQWIWDAYLPSDWERQDPYLFPLRGELSGLPPTVICVAEYDVLRDEGFEFAERLRASGVPVELIHAADQMHGFANHTSRIASAAALIRETAERFKNMLG
ncbi:alpha/beta hydrolase [Tsukamurella sp. PLM1]|uniref:alpha/beta hydrolase n=1 Tax=Tsukamurella sp. PLM1 TaxID=2929795 RepID=UPI00205A2D1F|nr:alpha/beta hydrolase [Tsukamurella sp. PLM1]BDH56519.1 putative lipase/esterase [Tsukamurella sp. PLM1]